MKSKILALSLLFFLFACSTKEIEHRADSAFVALSGNKAYGFSKLGRVIPPNKYGFFMDGYIVTTPIIKKHDLDYKNGWVVLGNDGDEELDLSLEDGRGGGYHISFSMEDVDEIKKGTIAQDLINGDNEAIKKGFKNYGNDVDIIKLGNKKYDCIRLYKTKADSVTKEKTLIYYCYKISKDGKKYRGLNIAFTYIVSTHDKHPDPYFSFNDLLYRTKPMLDSLYIKDF